MFGEAGGLCKQGPRRQFSSFREIGYVEVEGARFGKAQREDSVRCWDVTGKSEQRQFNERGNTAGPSRILRKGVRLWVFAQQQAPTADRAT